MVEDRKQETASNDCAKHTTLAPLALTCSTVRADCIHISSIRKKNKKNVFLIF